MPLLAIAQVKFVNTTFAEAQEMAKKAGKELIVDVVRGPKVEEKVAKVFKDKALSKFINKNFVAARIDMNDPKNKDFGEYLYSLMYPCVVFYSSRGEQLESTNWYSVDAKKHDLKALAEKSLEAAAVKRANTRSINFRDLDFKQALEVAKTEGKLVFVDNYTTWCRPCKQMEMDVFTLNSVADFYNENFVCIKLDADKDPYKVAKNNGVKGFPGYLYFAPEGDVVFEDGGFNPEQKFIAFGRTAVQNFNDNKEIKLQKINLEEAMALAKKEGKMIFVDLSATWCGPCKQLKATTFKEPVVGRYYNSNFVNMYVECDVQKELAEQMKSKYGYSAFPTMLYLTADGELVHKYVGAGMKADEFNAIAKTAIDGKGLKYFADLYNGGNRTPETVVGYINLLGIAYETKKAGEVASEYLNSLTIEQLVMDANFKILTKNVNDLDAKSVQLVLNNKDKFTTEEAKKAVDRYESNLWAIKANSFVKRGDAPTFDKAGYNAFMKRLDKSSLSDNSKKEIAANSKLINAENLGDWKTYVNLTVASLKKGKATSMLSYNWGLRVAKNCKDMKLKTKFADALRANIGEMKEASWKIAFDRLFEDLKN